MFKHRGNFAVTRYYSVSNFTYYKQLETVSKHNFSADQIIKSFVCMFCLIRITRKISKGRIFKIITYFLTIMTHCLIIVFIRKMQVRKFLIVFCTKFHRVQSSSVQCNDERIRFNEWELKQKNMLDDSISIYRLSIFNLGVKI